jgi:uncharacterized phage protein (TIGR02220 family)
MAVKRMFSLKVIDTDLFLEMPISARLLYYDLGMRADDDGFVSSPKKISKMIGSSEDDFKILLAKGFIIPFESGVCVITHWKINNHIQKDRYTATIYKSEFAMLTDNQGEYVSEMDKKCIQNVNKMDTQNRLDKNRLDKVRLDKKKHSPEAEEILSYLNLKSGSNYRLIDSNLKLIDAILKKGYSKDDCMTVIDKKVQEWSGTDMQQYLRPLTLFSSKFDAYLNQPMTRKRSEFETTQDNLKGLYDKFGGDLDGEERSSKNIFDI